MTRFAVCGDDDGNGDGLGGEGRHSGRPSFKKPRISPYHENASAQVMEDLLAVKEEPGAVKETDFDVSTSLTNSQEEGDQLEQSIGVDEHLSDGRGKSIPPMPISVTLTDPDVLDCAICLESLCPPVYQCENGHIACSSCCTKMKNKCASCSWPIGYNRCRAIEKVLETVKVSCRNLEHGCKESILYFKKHDHEKTCSYAPCSCPYHGCDHVAEPERLSLHFAMKHWGSLELFHFDSVAHIKLEDNQNHCFLLEKNESILFVLDRTIDYFGSLISIICIAPSSSKKLFSYEMTAKDGETSIKVKTVAENMPKWTAQSSAKKLFVVPSDFIDPHVTLRLELNIQNNVK